MLVVGGEFRDLLNAIAHIDEVMIATMLPFRPKSTGLYLVEALGLVVRPLDVEQRVLLTRQIEVISGEMGTRVEHNARYFAGQLDVMRAQLRAGVPVSRMVVSLNDLSLESLVCQLLTDILGTRPATGAAPVAAAPQPETGLGSKLRRWLKFK